MFTKYLQARSFLTGAVNATSLLRPSPPRALPLPLLMSALVHTELDRKEWHDAGQRRVWNSRWLCGGVAIRSWRSVFDVSLRPTNPRINKFCCRSPLTSFESSLLKEGHVSSKGWPVPGCQSPILSRLTSSLGGALSDRESTKRFHPPHRIVTNKRME